MTDNAVPEFPYFVGSRRSRSGQALDVASCFDGRLIARTFRPDSGSMEEAVAVAAAAADQCAKLPTYERARILREMSEAVASRRDEFVRMLALEAGKPVKAGRVEVERCIFNLMNASEEAQRIESEYLPLDLFPAASHRWALVRRFPLGTILAITPFNFPLNLVAHKLAPAIAAGNSIVQKPATKTPICSLMLAECAYASGLPEDALSVLPCSGARAGELADDSRFALLTFTGRDH
ncbi:MAG: aldehyde dehydrogenase family protein [Acidobacteriota bacterium]